jgi:hypothetical protein
MIGPQRLIHSVAVIAFAVAFCIPIASVLDRASAATRFVSANDNTVKHCSTENLSAHLTAIQTDFGYFKDVNFAMTFRVRGPECTIPGLPENLRLVSSTDGSAIGVRSHTGVGAHGRYTVPFPSNQSATLWFQWLNWCSPAPGALSVQIFLPGQKEPVVAHANRIGLGQPRNVPGCQQSKSSWRPSDSSIVLYGQDFEQSLWGSVGPPKK